MQAALARIRQLGAHEVGHAIGFEHNFAGSTQGRAR
ncbi:zinc-dependent metalloprotease [Sphingomonas sp. MMS24-JH45]